MLLNLSGNKNWASDLMVSKASVVKRINYTFMVRRNRSSIVINERTKESGAGKNGFRTEQSSFSSENESEKRFVSVGSVPPSAVGHFSDAFCVDDDDDDDASQRR